MRWEDVLVGCGEAVDLHMRLAAARTVAVGMVTANGRAPRRFE